MKPELFILTGSVHTGKSTALQHWIDSQRASGKVVRGLLNPDVHGRKQFIDAHSGVTWNMETEQDEPVIIVGKYTFSVAAFERARTLIEETSRQSCDVFVLDEIGKLELRNEGLEPAVSSVIQALPNLPCKTIILVIRDYLLDVAQQHYSLQDASVISMETLSDL